MTPEELLKPRVKVKSAWPGGSTKEGDILPVEEGDRIIVKMFALGQFFEMGLYYKSYPLLFKQLEWWQDRNPQDLTEYVKGIKGYFNNRIYKVADPSQNGREFHPDGEIEHRTFIKWAFSFLPATKEEYESYITSKA